MNRRDKIKGYSKRLLGGLTIQNLEKGLHGINKIISLTREADTFAKDNNLDSIRKITDPLISNRHFQRLEQISNVGERILSNRNTRLFNPVPDNINEEGERYAREARSRMERRSTIRRPSISEEQQAIDIVNRIK